MHKYVMGLLTSWIAFLFLTFHSTAFSAEKVVVVPLFRDTTATAVAPVEKTGQNTCYNTAGELIDCAGTGQDGDLQSGVAWPNPRFTDNNDGTVTDNMTGLKWTKTLACTFNNWQGNLDACNALANGTCGLTDNSTAGDWHLANLREFLSLLDYSNSNPTLPTGHPFSVNASANFVTSTTPIINPISAWLVGIYSGSVGQGAKTGNWSGACVRGSQ